MFLQWLLVTWELWLKFAQIWCWTKVLAMKNASVSLSDSCYLFYGYASSYMSSNSFDRDQKLIKVVLVLRAFLFCIILVDNLRVQELMWVHVYASVFHCRKKYWEEHENLGISFSPTQEITINVVRYSIVPPSVT